MMLSTIETSGVYVISNRVNSKLYIGSAAKSLKQRSTTHRNELRRGEHPNIHLQRAWTKYGEQAFEFTVILLCIPNECLAREQALIDALRTCDPNYGYNICPTAGSRLGTQQSEDSKLRNRQKHLGKRATDETKLKMSETRKGREVSESHRVSLKAAHWSKGPRAKEIAARIAAKHTGVRFTEERKRNISLGKLKSQ